MNSFKDFGIKATSKTFIGDKIKVEKVLNKEIVVHDFKIEDSKVKAGTKCLYLQIELANEKRVLWTGSGVLLEMIQQVPKDRFPFKTTIQKDNDRLEFT